MSVGYNGFSWSAATSDIAGLDLNFHSQYLTTCHLGHRGQGFQLRCLSE
ncbi:hypothetical protein [uncultured Rikenella sp.]|nr:hypothetical protein [uncultured Rikenella sp.]